MYFLRSALCLLTVLVLGVIAAERLRPPEPAPASIPLTGFSGMRAFAHVQKIGQRPHPLNSEENAAVRQYIVNVLTGLGFRPEVQEDIISLPGAHSQEKVNNILVRVRGTDPGKAVLLSAHYDSVKTGPGAADDSASVSAILETLRALKNLPSLQNDVIALFTNGEENNLLGAHAFVDYHRWFKDIALVLNFEYRGNSGAFMMFETGDGNGKLIQALAQVAPSIQTNSLMYEVYQRLPNDTDFSVFKKAHIPGMNFAAIEGFQFYHSQNDRPEYLNLGTLQHQGDVMLGLVQHFGNLPLDNLSGENRIYFDITGFGVINYPASWAPYFAGLLTLMWLLVAMAALKDKPVRIVRLIIAAIVFPVVIAGLYFVNLYTWSGLVEFAELDEAVINFDNRLSYGYLLSFIFVNLGVLGAIFYLSVKWLNLLELQLGIAAGWLIAAVLLNVNGASFVIVWPLFGVLTSWLVINTFSLAGKPYLLMAALFAGCIPGILIFVPLVINLFVALTAEAMPIIVTLANVLIGLFLPAFAAIIQPRLLSAESEA